jgi:hypothetical protein
MLKSLLPRVGRQVAWVRSQDEDIYLARLAMYTTSLLVLDILTVGTSSDCNEPNDS